MSESTDPTTGRRPAKNRTPQWIASTAITAVIGALLAVAVTDLQGGRDRRAGAWLGLAAAIKLTPLLFLLALPGMGRWRAAVVMLSTNKAMMRAPRTPGTRGAGCSVKPARNGGSAM